MTNMTSLNFRLKKIDKTRDYLLHEIKHNHLMIKKHKQVCRNLNSLEFSLLLISAVIGPLSNSTFTTLLSIPVGITSSVVGLKVCAITAGIKNYKLVFKKKKKKKYDKIVLLGKTNGDTIGVLISKAFNDSCISHDEFVSVSNVLRLFDC